MHTEVFNYIDTLIEMAGSTNKNIDEVQADLITLKRQIRNKKNEIEDFKSIINDARYFNASNELVDKNIEVSLKNKINRLKRKIKDIEVTIKDLTTNEEVLHKEIKDLKNKLSKDEEYAQIIRVKAKTNNNAYYQKMLDNENNNVKELQDILNNKKGEYNNLLKELELNNQAKEELNKKLLSEQERLSDILDNLNNPNSYIDEDLKQSDEDKLKDLEADLEKLEKRELELLTNASVIGTDAKELITINDIYGAMQKIRELVTIVKDRPYMDINNSAILDEELEKKENLRIELASLIDSKNYEGINNDAIKSRIDYLNNEISNNKELSAKLNNEINTIDEEISGVLGEKVSSLEEKIISSEKTVQEYKDLLKAKENSGKLRTNLEQGIVKKQSEIQILNNILSAYKNALVKKIEETNKLHDWTIELEKENRNNSRELEELQTITLMNYQTKDYVEEEKDREDLRKINEEIKQIKMRKKFDKSPNEIYDLIEMAFANSPTSMSDNVNEGDSSKTEEILDKVIEDKNVSSLDENIVLNEPIKEANTNDLIKVIDMIPVETKKEGGSL